MPPTRRALLAAPALLVLPRGLGAAGYPERPVRLIVAFTPGGSSDIVARLVGNVLAERWGQPVVIENRPGAGGNIGTDYVAHQPADGYTLLVGSVGPLAVNPSLYRSLPYDTLRDLAPVTLMAGVPNVLVVAPELGVGSVAALVARAKERPGTVSYGSTGVGTSAHLSGAMMEQMAGVTMMHVPYRGAVALNDLLTGRLDCMFATIPSVIEQIRSGTLKALAVSSLEGSRSLPEVPTMAAQGFAGFDASSWFGLLAPAGTPPAIVAKIAADAAAAVKQPEMERQMIAQGADPVGNSPEQFADFIRREIARWAVIVRASGARVE